MSSTDEKYQKVLECIESLNFNDGTYLRLCNALKSIKDTPVEEPVTPPPPPPPPQPVSREELIRLEERAERERVRLEREQERNREDTVLYNTKKQEYATKALLTIGAYPDIIGEKLYAERHSHSSSAFCKYMLSYYKEKKRLCKLDMVVYENNIKNKVKGHIRSSQRIIKVYNSILSDIHYSSNRWHNGGVS